MIDYTQWDLPESVIMSRISELQGRREQAMPRGMPNLHPIYVDRAENAEIWDVEGRRYIDFGTGTIG